MRWGEPFGGVLPGARGAVLAALMRTGTPLTGRRLQSVVGETFSLWSVQQAVRELADLGLVESRQVGRAVEHRVNDDHVAVRALRPILSPLRVLTEVVAEAAGPGVEAVLLFGSVARGESHEASDVDLVVLAPASWDLSDAVADAVRRRLGGSCDVLHFTREEFTRLKDAGEPVVADILRDGVTLVGEWPRLLGRAVS